jgi:exosortase/archaeosortase family protein
MNSILKTHFHSTNSIFFRFITRLLACYFLWEISFYIIGHNPNLLFVYRSFSLWVIDGILNSTNFALNLLQYETAIDYGARVIRLIGTGGVTVGEPCIGYGVMGIFFGLIISYPGHLNQKIWFLPLGLFLIYTANIIRIMVLAITVEINPDIWEFNHKFIFKIVVYSIVLLLWGQWITLTKKTS